MKNARVVSAPVNVAGDVGREASEDGLGQKDSQALKDQGDPRERMDEMDGMGNQDLKDFLDRHQYRELLETRGSWDRRENKDFVAQPVFQALPVHQGAV